jgi:hypothetical protein
MFFFCFVRSISMFKPGSSVNVVIRLRVARSGFDSRQGQGFFLFATSRPALGPTQPPIQGVPGSKRPESEADHSPLSSAEVKKARSYTFTLPYNSYFSVRYRIRSTNRAGNIQNVASDRNSSFYTEILKNKKGTSWLNDSFGGGKSTLKFQKCLTDLWSYLILISWGLILKYFELRSKTWRPSNRTLTN